jgi:hypothetical protein
MSPKNSADPLVTGSALLDDSIESISAGGLGNAIAPKVPNEMYINVSSVEEPHTTVLTSTLGFFSFSQAGMVTENA